MKKIFLSSILMGLSILTQAQPATYYPKGIGGGGALYFPAINPANDDEFYIGCDMSEIFHSTDFGQSYSQLPFTKLTVMRNSTYEFTMDPDIAFAIYNDGNEGYPVRTVDGGNSWVMLPGFDAGLGKVYRIAANYNNPDQLIMGYYGDLVISNNGGSTFTLIKHASNMGAGIILGGVVNDGNNIYIGTNEGIFYSTNAGSSFSKMSDGGIPTQQVIWNFTGAREGNKLRFFCITANLGDVYNGLMPWDYYDFAKGVYSMDDASGSWVPKMIGMDFSSDFIMYAGMAGNDINTIYLAGNDHALFAPLIYKSSDGGNTWNKVFMTTGNENITTGWCGFNGDKAWSWAETCFGIAVSPVNSDKVVFGDYGYVHTTSDGGATWKQAYVDSADQHPAGQSTPKKQLYRSIGLEPTSCWQVYWTSPDHLFGAFSDIGGIRSTDHGQSWSYNYNGFAVNSLYRITGLQDGTIFAATSYVHDLYQSTRLKDAQLDVTDATGNIYYSTDGGSNWSLLHAFGHPVFWIAVDPGNPNRMYASIVHYGGGGSSSRGGIWMTSDLGNLSSSQWTQLPAPPRTEGHPASIEVLNDGKMVCTFSGRINPSGSFTPSSGVYVYDPSLNSWSDVSDPGMYYWTKDVVIDPRDAAQNTWYVGVFSGWGGPPNGLGGLYMTTNRGANWIKLTGNQFDRVTSLTFNPSNPNQAYLTTEMQGLWVSQGMQATIPSWDLVDSYPFRQPERVFFNPFNTNEMWVTSFGNGIKTGIMIPTPVSDVPSKGSDFSVYPNPFNEKININITSTLAYATVRVVNVPGQEIFTAVFKNGYKEIDSSGWPSGIYFLSIETGSSIFTQKLIKR
jgi:photosystem II stability/assembly factor-like uncharacterized protein